MHTAQRECTPCTHGGNLDGTGPYGTLEDHIKNSRAEECQLRFPFECDYSSVAPLAGGS
jgi:hypothetical protein